MLPSCGAAWRDVRSTAAGLGAGGIKRILSAPPRAAGQVGRTGRACKFVAALAGEREHPHESPEISVFLHPSPAFLFCFLSVFISF